MLSLTENATALEKLFYGLKVMLLGMGTVFVVLFLLWLVLMLLQLLYRKKNVPETVDGITGNIPTVDATPLQVSTAIEAENDENELIAVIMAAVYAASGATPGSLRMISCKKRQKTPWNRK